jgi:hypothetical protein
MLLICKLSEEQMFCRVELLKIQITPGVWEVWGTNEKGELLANVFKSVCIYFASIRMCVRLLLYIPKNCVIYFNCTHHSSAGKITVVKGVGNKRTECGTHCQRDCLRDCTNSEEPFSCSAHFYICIICFVLEIHILRPAGAATSPVC